MGEIKKSLKKEGVFQHAGFGSFKTEGSKKGQKSYERYNYLIVGSYEATILGTPDRLKSPPPAEISIRRLLLNVIPDLRKPDVFFYDEGAVLLPKGMLSFLIFVLSVDGFILSSFAAPSWPPTRPPAMSNASLM